MDGSPRLEHWQSVCLIWTATLSISPGLVFHCVLILPLCVSSALVLSLCAFDILIHGHSRSRDNKTMWGLSAKSWQIELEGVKSQSQWKNWA